MKIKRVNTVLNTIFIIKSGLTYGEYKQLSTLEPGIFTLVDEKDRTVFKLAAGRHEEFTKARVTFPIHGNAKDSTELVIEIMATGKQGNAWLKNNASQTLLRLREVLDAVKENKEDIVKELDDVFEVQETQDSAEA